MIPFGIQHLLNERLAQISSEQDTFIKTFLDQATKPFGINARVLEFSSFYREIEVIEENKNIWLLFDHSYFEFVIRLSLCAKDKDFESALAHFRYYMSTFMLENSLIYDSKFSAGYFTYFSIHSNKNLDANNFLENNLDFVFSSMLSYIKYFTVQHEMAHIVIRYHEHEKQKLSKAVSSKILYLLNLNVEKLSSETTNAKHKELASKLISDAKTFEELMCDINAIISCFNMAKTSEELYSLILAIWFHYKIMLTISGLKSFMMKEDTIIGNKKYKTNDEYSYENNLRLNLRLSYLMDLIFFIRFKGDKEKFSSLKEAFDKNYKPFVIKFYKIIDSYLSEIKDESFAYNIIQSSRNDKINYSREEYLKILGWLS